CGPQQPRRPVRSQCRCRSQGSPHNSCNQTGAPLPATHDRVSPAGPQSTPGKVCRVHGDVSAGLVLILVHFATTACRNAAALACGQRTPAEVRRRRRTGTLEPSPGSIDTELIDLTTITISALRNCDEEMLEPSMHRLLVQVRRSRANIGSGPPGRVD